MGTCASTHDEYPISRSKSSKCNPKRYLIAAASNGVNDETVRETEVPQEDIDTNNTPLTQGNGNSYQTISKNLSIYELMQLPSEIIAGVLYLGNNQDAGNLKALDTLNITVKIKNTHIYKMLLACNMIYGRLCKCSLP